jgi:hypothetical protein
LFVGHYAVAFAAKRATPHTSLGVLVIAAQLIDLLWPMFLLVGLEHVRIAPGITRFTPLDFYDYPITHSLIGALAWSVVFASVILLFKREARTALICALLVFSHWVLDLIVHRPDLPLGPHGPYVGLGLWNHVALSFAVEGTLFVLGLWIYLRTTTARDSIGRYGLIGFIALLILFWVPGPFSAPPPSARAVAWLGMGQWLLVAIAFWIDAHRTRTAANR